jgi:APA family basic amino acid/polyamine antiporter
MSKKLSLFDSTTIIMGSMIGSGIFIVSASIAQQVKSPGLLIGAWVLTAIITMLGALSYGELAAMYPQAGGQYVYLREAYGKRTAFLYGWSLFSVIQTGTIAAVGMAFAKFLGVFWDDCSSTNIILDLGFKEISLQQLVAIASIVALTLVNYRGVKNSALVQNIFTVAKILALVIVVLAGLFIGMNGIGDWGNFSPALPDVFTWGTLGIFGAAMTGSLFSADAWNNITYTAGEVENPKRNLPLSLALGTGSVLLIYILVNIMYVYVMPITEIANAPQERVGTAFMQKLLGDSGQYWMAGLIMLSTFGCLNGLIFTAPRAYMAMAKDGLFFKKAANLTSDGVPKYGLTIQMLWSGLLCLSGQYNQLLDFLIIVVLIFYILTVGGLFILRKKKPEMERPYKAVGYPFLPALYIILAVWVSINIIVNQTENSLYGIGIMLLGLPIYYFFHSKSKNSDA